MREKEKLQVKIIEEAVKENLERKYKKTIKHLLDKIDRLKEDKAELAEAIYRAARDGIDALDISTDMPPRTQPSLYKGKTPQVAIAVLSDWQLGKITPTYNSRICHERIRTYADKLIRIVEMHRSASPVDELRIYLLGDIVEGELVFPGQAHLIDSSLYKQVTLDGPKILSEFIRRMATVFSRIKVVCVYGNHGAIGGRSRKEMHPESNADLILYRITEYIFSESKNITFVMPDKNQFWYNIDRIGNKTFFLFHGDQMRGGGFAGIPFYSFSRAIYSWSSGAVPEGFDYAICGHWHQGASLPFNFKILWVNGSVESYNTYAQEQIKSMSAPHQWLLFCHPRHGVTAEYRIWLSADPYGKRVK